MRAVLHIQRKELAGKEDTLHDHLVEVTSRLNGARASVQLYESELQRTMLSLSEVRRQLDDLDRKIEAVWHRPAYSDS